MLPIVPEAERDAPFLQARTEIFSAVDGVQDRDPAAKGSVCPSFGEALLADQAQARKPRAEPLGEASLEEQVGFGDGTAVSLPGYVVAPLDQRGQSLGHEVPDTL